MKVYNEDGDIMYFTDNLKQIRKNYHLTIYDMAQKLGITPAYYSQLENKKRRLYYEMAIKIANIFKKTPDDIFLVKTVK
ncbi:MAG: helix-turn-helix transcriptional regulator [Bacilli bacterium]|nr:helix-turn-helix transcriptional regulator [Bacilli bacterium]